LLLAGHISDLRGNTVVDLGTGSGLLGIVAAKRGAAKVYVLDTYPAAIDVALNNAALNGVAHCSVHVPTGKEMLRLPAGERGGHGDLQSGPASVAEARWRPQSVLCWAGW
jgi:ribosomal protein L11 methylase PrmA